MFARVVAKDDADRALTATSRPQTDPVSPWISIP
jgi:hypothetical protein